MADEQVILSVKVEADEIKKAEKSIDALSNSIDLLGNNIKEARDENKKYKQRLVELDEQLAKNKKLTADEALEVQKLNEKIGNNNKEIAANTQSISKLRRERNANIKLIQNETTSLTNLEAKASLLNQAISKQETATEEGRKAYKKYEKELGEVNKKVNEQRLAFKDTTKNIGNYTESINKSKVFTGEFVDSLEDVGGASGNAVSGVKTLGQSFKALIANPIVLVISLLVAGLVALFSAFKKSESGAKLLEKGSAALEGLFLALTKIAGFLADAITSAFEDPKGAVIALWETIKTNLVNRFTGVIDLFESGGKIIAQVFKAMGAKIKLYLADVPIIGKKIDAKQAANDLSDAMRQIEESAKDAGTATIQIASGLDKVQQSKVADTLSDIVSETEKLTKQSVKLASAQRAVRAQMRSMDKDIAKLQGGFDLLSEILGDDTQAMTAIETASQDALKAAIKLAEQEEKRAKLALNLINQEVALRRSAGEDIQDLLDQQAQAEIDLTNARSQAAIAQYKIGVEQRKNERDIFEQNLDILIDVGDKIKSEGERQVKNDKLTLKERITNLEALRIATAANFSEVSKEYERYGVTAQQINEVVSASDAKQTNERLKALGLNEIANNRLREIILERRQAELDFADLDKELSDAEIENIKEVEKVKEEAKIKQEEQDEKDKEKRAERYEELKENLEKINDIVNEFAGAQASVFGSIALGIANAFDDGKVSAEGALAGIGIAAQALLNGSKERTAEELTLLEQKKNRELELAGENEAAKAEIEERYEKQRQDLELKQFRSEKAAAIAQIAIQTAISVAKVWGQTGLGGIIAQALPIGMGLIQAGIVLKQKPPTFGDGTDDIVNIGGSHASGNDVDVYGVSGNQKQYFGKVEKGEAMPVIRKSAVNDYQIAKLNGSFNATSQKFANGTNDITTTQSPQLSIADIQTAMQAMNISVKVEDITDRLSKKANVVNNSKV